MLRLQISIRNYLFPSSSVAFPKNSPPRLLFASAAPHISPNPSFAVEDYLVDTCGLTRAQALKASGKISHLKSPSKPDAVLSFLAGLGLSSAAIAATVAKDPQLLCAKVEKTLDSNVRRLMVLGLSSSEVARLVSLVPNKFRIASIVSKLQYYLPLFGSSENLLRALKANVYFLSSDLDKVVTPNIVFLRECGLRDCDVVKISIRVPRILSTNPERVRTMVACAESLGVPRGSGMFRQVLQAVRFLSKEAIAAKVDYLKYTFTWSDAEVGFAVCKAPMVLAKSKESLQRASDFLISEAGLEPAYVARHSTMILYSLEGRTKPRHYVVKFLTENGLLDHNLSYNSVLVLGEKRFMEMFICPHKEAAPHLAEDYAAACTGEVPSRLIFA
uniref:Uncharacterized protein n=1 Tax=Avena sativa TaxID=4498 RepID=A0ACD5TBA2_AVESA